MAPAGNQMGPHTPEIDRRPVGHQLMDYLFV